LRDVYDDHDLASWFAHGNELLGGGSPASVIDSDPDAVLDAARTDAFIARW
jgi:hypothetical protein